MKRLDTFTFRLTEQERLLINVLSERLKRTRSDAVRWVIREAANALVDESESAVSKRDSN